jgi:hypothetical protein
MVLPLLDLLFLWDGIEFMDGLKVAGMDPLVMNLCKLIIMIMICLGQAQALLNLGPLWIGIHSIFFYI